MVAIMEQPNVMQKKLSEMTGIPVISYEDISSLQQVIDAI